MINCLDLATVFELKRLISLQESSPTILIILFQLDLKIMIFDCLLSLLVYHFQVVLGLGWADGVLRGDFGRHIVTLVLFLGLSNFIILILYVILITVAILNLLWLYYG